MKKLLKFNIPFLVNNPSGTKSKRNYTFYAENREQALTSARLWAKKWGEKMVDPDAD